MNTITVIETTFSGAHSLTGHPLCGDKHGHHWRVTVEIVGDEKDLVDVSVADIYLRIGEYHRTDLDRFIPGVRTSESGLAAFFRERLADFPIRAITVSAEPGYAVRVEWQLR